MYFVPNYLEGEKNLHCDYNRLMDSYRLSRFINHLKSNIAYFIYAFIVFAIGLFIFQFLVSAEYDKAEVKEQIETANFANALKSKVDQELNALLFVTNGLSSYLTIYHRELDEKKLQAILADLYLRTKNVRNLAVAVGYKITYIHPIETNEKALGIDYRDIPDHWIQVKKAVDTRQGVLVGPVDLVQGGRGIIYRYPVFIKGKYWGLLSTVINTDSFLKSAFNSFANDEYTFAIRIKSSATVFFGDAALFQNPEALISVSDFPGETWEWAVLQKTKKVSRLIRITQIMGVLISLLLATLVYFFLRERRILTLLAMRDSLTGLANRRLLDLRLTQTFAQAKRFKRTMAVMIIDVDHFKKLNDTYGHDVGDEILKAVASKLNHCIRNVDTLSRVGGDEFVIVLDVLNHIDDVHTVAKKIMAGFSNDITVMAKDIKVSLSIGIASYHHNSDDTLKDLLKKADIALYEAKAAGRNGYMVFHEIEKMHAKATVSHSA